MRFSLVLVLALFAGCRDDEAATAPAAAKPTAAPAVATEPLPTGPLKDGETAAARVEAIMERVDLRSTEQIQQAEALLVELGPAAIPAMVEELRVGGKPPGGVDRRYVLARALRVHGPAASAAIPLLTPLLGGAEQGIDQRQPAGSTVKVTIIENSELRNASAEALGAMGAVAIPALVGVLRGVDPVARTKAATALQFVPAGELDRLDAATAAALARALEQAIPDIEEQRTRRRAQEILDGLRARPAAD